MGNNDLDGTDDYDGAGNLEINISNLNLESLETETNGVEIQSDIDERFTSYKTEIRIVYVGTDRSHTETYQNEELNEIFAESVEFTNIIPGFWNVKVTLEAKYGDDEWYPVASGEVGGINVKGGEAFETSITIDQKEGVSP